MDKKLKQEFKKQLLEKKQEITKKLSETYNESKELEPGIAQDLVDKAETSYTKEFLLNLSDVDRKVLIQIDDALKRIEKCDFGICQMCGKQIGKKRLDAISWTPYCIICQEKAEEEGF